MKKKKLFSWMISGSIMMSLLPTGAANAAEETDYISIPVNIVDLGFVNADRTYCRSGGSGFITYGSVKEYSEVTTEEVTADDGTVSTVYSRTYTNGNKFLSVNGPDFIASELWKTPWEEVVTTTTAKVYQNTLTLDGVDYQIGIPFNNQSFNAKTGYKNMVNTSSGYSGDGSTNPYYRTYDIEDGYYSGISFLGGAQNSYKPYIRYVYDGGEKSDWVQLDAPNINPDSADTTHTHIALKSNLFQRVTETPQTSTDGSTWTSGTKSGNIDTNASEFEDIAPTFYLYKIDDASANVNKKMTAVEILAHNGKVQSDLSLDPVKGTNYRYALLCVGMTMLSNEEGMNNGYIADLKALWAEKPDEFTGSDENLTWLEELNSTYEKVNAGIITNSETLALLTEINEYINNGYIVNLKNIWAKKPAAFTGSDENVAWLGELKSAYEKIDADIVTDSDTSALLNEIAEYIKDSEDYLIPVYRWLEPSEFANRENWFVEVGSSTTPSAIETGAGIEPAGFKALKTDDAYWENAWEDGVTENILTFRNYKYKINVDTTAGADVAFKAYRIASAKNSPAGNISSPSDLYYRLRVPTGYYEGISFLGGVDYRTEMLAAVRLNYSDGSTEFIDADLLRLQTKGSKNDYIAIDRTSLNSETGLVAKDGSYLYLHQFNLDVDSTRVLESIDLPVQDVYITDGVITGDGNTSHARYNYSWLGIGLKTNKKLADMAAGNFADISEIESVNEGENIVTTVTLLNGVEESLITKENIVLYDVNSKPDNDYTINVTERDSEGYVKEFEVVVPNKVADQYCKLAVTLANDSKEYYIKKGQIAGVDTVVYNGEGTEINSFSNESEAYFTVTIKGPVDAEYETMTAIYNADSRLHKITAIQTGTLKSEEETITTNTVTLPNSDCTGWKYKTFVWDKNSGMKPLSSTNNLFGLNFKLDSVEGANENLEVFGQFKKMTTGRTYQIPGFNDTYVPQGVAYREDTDQIYASGYFKDGRNSVIYVFDAKTGEYVNDFILYNPSGTNCTSHAGGVTFTKNYLYMTSGRNLLRVKISTIDSTPKGGNLQFEESIKLGVGNAGSISFCDYSNGYLWTGEFFDDSDETYNDPATEEYEAFFYGYKIDEETEEEFNPENKTGETADYVPDILWYLPTRRVQGATSWNGKLYLSASRGPADSILYSYEIPNPEDATEFYTVDGKKVPFFTLNATQEILMPSMSEDLAMNGSRLLINFESGALSYRDYKHKMFTDRIWEIDLSELTE